MRIVFEPIREELERELGAPQAREEEMSDVEKLRQQALEEEGRQKAESGTQQNTESASTAYRLPPTANVSFPATPPPPPPTEKISRAPASGAYVPGETSAARASIVDDPYREAPL
jgi:hypothetical protein